MSQGAKQCPNIFFQFSAVLHGISKSRGTFQKTQKTTFLDLRVFDVFCVFLIDFCGFFAGKVSCFFDFIPKKMFGPVPHVLRTGQCL